MQTHLRLFGLDLVAMGSDAWQALKAMVHWPLLAWLMPRPSVQRWGMTSAGARAPTGRFQVVELPETLLLRRHMALPGMSAGQIDAALALEVMSCSPFVPEHTLSMHQVTADHSGQRVELVITSLPLVQQHLAELGASPQRVEVWVPMAQGHAVLPGFGEATRQRSMRRGFALAVALVIGCLGWLGAMAVTPTLQLRAQALQAVEAFDALTHQAAPVLQLREALLVSQGRAEQIAAFQAEGTAALPSLLALTQALPDGTFLLSLQLQGSFVRMTGQTPNAAALMTQLGSVAGITEVRAPTPATRPPGASSESFSIELMLKPVATGPAS